MLLASIIEAVTGRALHDVHEEMLYRPLGLRRTWIAGRSRPLDPAPEPAALWAGHRPLDIPLLMRSFHGVYSTADDMLVVLRTLIRGGLFERPDTFDLMRARWVRFGLAFDRAAFRGPQWPIEYGLGLMRFQMPRVLTPFRPMPAVIGHTGSTGTWLFHCPAQDLLLAGTVDQVTAGAVPFRVVPKLLRIADKAQAVPQTGST
jgi:CubicO group peptidase (beta-lactamase class C family)